MRQPAFSRYTTDERGVPTRARKFRGGLEQTFRHPGQLSPGPKMNNPLIVVPLLALPLLLAWPPFDWPGMGWVALAPVMLSLKYLPGKARQWFAAGWGFGVVFYAFQFAWLPRAMLELGGLPFRFFLGFALLGLTFLALFPAVVIGLSRLAQERGLSPYFVFPVLVGIQEAVLGVFPFNGMPWGSLAATQTHTLAARLLLPLAGAPALALALAGLNALWAWAAGEMIAGKKIAVSAPLALALGLLILFQPWPPAPARQEGRGFTALLVPGDLTLAQMHGEFRGREGLRYYLARSLQWVGERGEEQTKTDAPNRPPLAQPQFDAAVGRARTGSDAGEGNRRRGADLVIWPESAVNGRVEEGKLLSDLAQVGEVLGVDFILGSEARERGADFNSAYLVIGKPFDFFRYDKRELVPFGEYVPTGFRWAFGKKVTAGEADYRAGEAPPVLRWRGVEIGMAICFESVLPAHMRRAVRSGAQAIVALANDQWLTPAAGLQHLRLTALRGLEIGRDVLFVSNGGWSAHLREGRVVAGGERGGPVRAEPTLSSAKTPWVRWGYYPFTGLALLLLVGGWLCRRE